MKKLLSILFFSIFLALLFSITTFAYIDPSAMTYIIQIIAGVVIAAGAAFGFYWRRIKRALSKKFKNNEPEDIDYDIDDDDDEGYDDYDLDEFDDPDDYDAEEITSVSTKSDNIPHRSDTLATAAPSKEVKATSVIIDEPYIPEPVPDEFDEGSDYEMLLHENRELKKLLAIEREKVEILKKSLHICTKD